MSSPPLEIDGKPLSTAGASQLAMIWWYTAAINFKRRKKNSFLEWDRRWVPRSPSIYYYIYILYSERAKYFYIFHLPFSR
jgi:hypothetical protein